MKTKYRVDDKGRKNERREDGQTYEPSGRGGEGPEGGSIMSSEVTLYLQPLLSGPGMMEPSRQQGMDGCMGGGWMKKCYRAGTEEEEKCRNENISSQSVIN